MTACPLMFMSLMLRLVLSVLLVTAVGRSQQVSIPGETATWGAQSPLLPEYEWVVLDHADGISMGYGVATTGEAVFVCGSMSGAVRLENPATGAFVEATREAAAYEGEVYLAKVSLSGEPAAVWVFPGSAREFPAHLAASADEAWVAMTGYFGGNVSFGEDFSFENTKAEDRDGFVVKIDAADGTVAWARHVASPTAETIPGGVAFDAAGNVAFVGRRCETTTALCEGFLTVLKGDDGSSLYTVSFGPEVPALEDVAYSSSSDRYFAAGSLTGTVDVGGGQGLLEHKNASGGQAAALVLALEAASGIVSWAATADGSSENNAENNAEASSTFFPLVEAKDGAVYVGCSGACRRALSSQPSGGVAVELRDDEGMGGAVFKFDEATGAPVWAAAAPAPLGLALAGDGVYVTTHLGGAVTFGDTTFSSRGSLDQYVIKVDAAGGRGEWVLQAGGVGLEYVRRMATDHRGDLYTIGLTQSHPAFFGDFALDTHDAADGYDVFIAKIRTSAEALPACRASATEVLADACFVGNLCYAANDTSLVLGDYCRLCDPAVSQSAFTTLDLATSCFIDDTCVHDGAFRSSVAASPFFSSSTTTNISPCQTCDRSVALYDWTLLADYVLLDDNVTCVFAPAGLVIAGYGAFSPDVAALSYVDKDFQEFEDLADAHDWQEAKFLYENGGGGGNCTLDQILDPASASCFGKNHTDAAGNVVLDNGDVLTIQALATAGPDLMTNETYWTLYRDYFDDATYADTFIRNAISGNWTSRSDALRAELAAKGAAYQALWMYVVHKLEEAVARCDLLFLGTTIDSVSNIDNATMMTIRAWDEAWALYAGSLEGADGAGKGYLLYDLAEKRCPQFFDTCGQGAGRANEEALAIALAGRDNLLAGDCDAAKAAIPNFVAAMTVPLVQGLMRYLYLADPNVNGGSCSDGRCDYDKEWAEAWAFAAAVLPQIDHCNSSVALLLVDNVDVDGPATPLSDGYVTLKAQVESTYACMNISCSDVGALIDPDGIPFPGMEACA